MQQFKDRLRVRREALGLTQKGLAEAAGITPASLNLLEKGTNKMPRADVALRLAERLGVSARWLVLGAGPPGGGTLEPELLERVLALADRAVAELAPDLDPRRRAALAAALYRLAVDPADPGVDDDLADLAARVSP